MTRKDPPRGQPAQDAPSDEHFVEIDHDTGGLKHGFGGLLSRLPIYVVTSGRLRRLSNPALLLYVTISVLHANWKLAGKFWAGYETLADEAKLAQGLKPKIVRRYIGRLFDEFLALGMVVRMGRMRLKRPQKENDTRAKDTWVSSYRLVVSGAEADQLIDSPDAEEASERHEAFKRSQRARAKRWLSKMGGRKGAPPTSQRADAPTSQRADAPTSQRADAPKSGSYKEGTLEGTREATAAEPNIAPAPVAEVTAAIQSMGLAAAAFEKDWDEEKKQILLSARSANGKTLTEPEAEALARPTVANAGVEDFHRLSHIFAGTHVRKSAGAWWRCALRDHLAYHRGSERALDEQKLSARIAEYRREGPLNPSELRGQAIVEKLTEEHLDEKFDELVTYYAERNNKLAMQLLTSSAPRTNRYLFAMIDKAEKRKAEHA